MEPKILLIDDSAILRRIAVNVLSTRGICGEVITATRATEGFARACTSGVGLALVDHQIAGWPDADWCRRLLAEPRTSRIRIIVLLGPGMLPPSKESLPANVVDFLVKPFTPEQLVSTVKAALNAVHDEAPVGRLREPATVPPVLRSGPPRDDHEVAAVVNATALVRRQTIRLQHAVAASRKPETLTAAVREASPARVHFDPARLRTAFVEAVQRRETGAFRIRANGGPCTEVYLENGDIVVVATLDARHYAEDADSVVPPKVSPAILDAAVAEQAQTGIPFLLSLGARGLLSKSAATGLLRPFGQRQFARFWTVPQPSLSFEFVGLDALPGFALRLEPSREPVHEWLLDAARHLRSQDIAVQVRHEGLGGMPSLTKDGETAAAALPWNDQERDFLRQIGTRRDLAAVAKNLGIPAEQAYLILFRFRCLGIMDYRPTGSAFVVTPRTNVRRVLPLQR